MPLRLTVVLLGALGGVEEAVPLSTLTPSERVLRSRLGGLSKAARCDGFEGTSAARALGPGQDLYWERQVDPDSILPTPERARRAEAAKKAHFTRMALKSAIARRKR